MKTRGLWRLSAALLLGAACGDGGGTGAEPREPVRSVAVAPDTLTLAVGQTQALQAETRGAGGVVLSGRQVAWSSLDEAVATVSAGGMVTARAAGVAVIRATSEGRAGQARVTVAAAPPVNPVPVVTALSPDSAAAGGPDLAVTVTGTGFRPDGRVQWNGVARPTTYVSESEVRVQLWAGDLAQVGEAEVRAVNGAPGGGASNAVRFRVVPQRNPVASVRVRPSLSVTRVGSPVPLTATLLDGAGQVLTGRLVTWTSSDARVATVDGTGRVTAVGEGHATLTAESEGKRATTALTVTREAYHLLLDDGAALRTLDMRLGGEPELLWAAPAGSAVTDPNPSADARWVVYAIDGRHLAVLDLATATYRTIATHRASDQPAWSPAGERIAFRGVTGTRSDVWVVNPDGTGLVNLTADLPEDHSEQPAWSPDGNRIAFSVRTPGGGTHLWVMNADGSGKRMITLGGWDTEPAWSGDQIVFTRRGPDGSTDIWRVSAAGTAPVRLTDRGDARSPAWSPDGRWIAFVAGGGAGRGDVMAISAVDGEVRPLTLSSDSPRGGGFNPAWIRRP